MPINVVADEIANRDNKLKRYALALSSPGTPSCNLREFHLLAESQLEVAGYSRRGPLASFSERSSQLLYNLTSKQQVKEVKILCPIKMQTLNHINQRIQHFHTLFNNDTEDFFQAS